METGLSLRRHREARELGVRELARLAEVSPSMLSKIEQGKRTPSLGMLQVLADALQIDVGALLDPNDQEA